MTTEELMNIPKGMDVIEYQNKLNHLEKIQDKMRKYSNKVMDEEDSMSVFDDHTDPRYIAHKEKYEQYTKKLKKIMNEYHELYVQLKGDNT